MIREAHGRYFIDQRPIVKLPCVFVPISFPYFPDISYWNRKPDSWIRRLFHTLTKPHDREVTEWVQSFLERSRQVTEEETNPLATLLVSLAQNNPGAASVLGLVIKHRGDGINILFDIDDMQMRGPQIWCAYKDYCNEDIWKFIRCCEQRDAEMVEMVNSELPALPPMRRHGEQKTIPPIDGAVKSILEEAKTIQRLDDGAEYVNAFFIQLITEMQKRQRFTTNVRINLGLESGEWAVFAIALAELQDRDGNPMQKKPDTVSAEPVREGWDETLSRVDKPLTDDALEATFGLPKDNSQSDKDINDEIMRKSKSAQQDGA